MKLNSQIIILHFQSGLCDAGDVFPKERIWGTICVTIAHLSDNQANQSEDFWLGWWAQENAIMQHTNTLEKSVFSLYFMPDLQGQSTVL